MKQPPLIKRLTCHHKVRAANIYKQTEDLVLLTVETNIKHARVTCWSDGYYANGKCLTCPRVEFQDELPAHWANAVEVEFPRFAGWSIIHAAEWCRGSVLVLFEDRGKA